MMSAAYHLAAISSGFVSKKNVGGIRKMINAMQRIDAGYSVGSTAPKITSAQLVAIERALLIHKPRVVGELHDSGLKLLRNPRYAKRLAPVARIIATIDHFELVGFNPVGNSGCTPVYRVQSPDGAFTFQNITWQSGGDGPEILS